MAKAKRQRRKIDTWKTKKWYDILAPPLFGEQKIGETLSSDPDNLVGRTIEAPLSNLIGDLSKQHVTLKFKITDVQDKTAKTGYVEHSITRAYMRSLIRRKTTRIEGVGDVVTKDGVKVRIKAIALALGRAQELQEKAIRKIMHGVAERNAKDMDFDKFIYDIVVGRVPTAMYREAGKIFPLKRLEVRKTEVISK